MDHVSIPAPLAAALHARLLKDLREAEALANALAQCQPVAPVEKEAIDGDQ